MGHEIHGDFVIFKSIHKEKVMDEMIAFLKINPHMRVFKEPTYDIIKLEWACVLIRKDV